jgi:hypothetical protein
MKEGSKNYLRTFFILSILFFGCNKDDLTISFETSDNFNFTLASGSVINIPFELITPEIPTNSSNEFEQNDTRADKIEEIILKELKLSILSPSGKTFSFLKSIEIFVSAEGLPEVLMASKYDFSSNLTTLALDCSPNDMANYVKQERYKVRVKTVTRESTKEDIEVNCFIKFSVKAAPLK